MRLQRRPDWVVPEHCTAIRRSLRLLLALRQKTTLPHTIDPLYQLAEKIPKGMSPYAFVFIESVSHAGMELEAKVKLKNSHPQTSFIFIFQATKDGKFRGGNDLAHEVDVIIEGGQNQASVSGRFNAGGRIEL